MDLNDFIKEFEELILDLDLSEAPLIVQTAQVISQISSQFVCIELESIKEFGLEKILACSKEYLSDLKLYCDVYLKKDDE